MTASHIEQSVVIARPVAEVFAFYRDFRNLPRFLGDVVAVEPAGERSWRWTIMAPLGIKIYWTVVETEIQPGALIAYETSSIAPTKWQINFSAGAESGSTKVRETMSIAGGQLTETALTVVGKPPELEVRANLQRLKELLETGSIKTMDHVVRGKFGA